MDVCATCDGTGLVETAEQDSRTTSDLPCPDCAGAALRPYLGAYHHPRWHLSCTGCSAVVEDDGEEDQAVFLARAWAEGWRAPGGDLVCPGCMLRRARGAGAVGAHEAGRHLWAALHARVREREAAFWWPARWERLPEWLQQELDVVATHGTAGHDGQEQGDGTGQY